jgi:predicted Holliday junction resolvase-like endonuclease
VEKVKTILILSGVIFLLIVAIVILFLILKKKNKEVRDLSGEVKALQSSIKILSEYIKRINDIKTDKEDFAERIAGAESDEEIENILNDIISANNGRVQNNG